jgi:UDP-N-acetylmuramyl pentapeptide synthase
MKFIQVSEDFKNTNYYYHGTTFENLQKIFQDKKLCVEYFDHKGIFITKDYSNALNFGEVVLAINRKIVNSKNITWDDTNDGLFYVGGFDIDEQNIDILICENDRRVMMSIMKSIISNFK